MTVITWSLLGQMCALQKCIEMHLKTQDSLLFEGASVQRTIGKSVQCRQRCDEISVQCIFFSMFGRLARSTTISRARCSSLSLFHSFHLFPRFISSFDRWHKRIEPKHCRQKTFYNQFPSTKHFVLFWFYFSWVFNYPKAWQTLIQRHSFTQIIVGRIIFG